MKIQNNPNHPVCNMMSIVST